MNSIFKTLGAAFAGFVLSVAAGHADTIVAVTETHYDANLRPDCVATRMDTTTFTNPPANACNLVAVGGVNGADRITKTVYDAAGQALQVIQAAGTSAQRTYATYEYSSNGKLVDSIDANGNRTHLIYDGFDRLIEFDYPSTTRPSAFNPSTKATALATAGAYNTVTCDASHAADCEAYAYDANGNKTYTRRRDGAAIYDCYDALNRGTRHLVSGTSGCPATGGAADVYSTYDLVGHVTAKTFVSISGNGVTYAYDGLGRVTSSTDGDNRTVSYLYNQASARTSMTLPDATVLNYVVDNANRVTSATRGTTDGLFSQGYDDLGHKTFVTKGGGGVTYGYDALGRLTSMTNDLSGSSNDITWTFSRNPANQVVKWTASKIIYDYVETTAATVAQTYDGLNRDAAIAATSNGYDLRGNLTQDAPGGTIRKLVYDVENRLLTKGPATGAADMTLVYDPEGRLSQYITSTATTEFLYDGTNLIGEYNHVGTAGIHTSDTRLRFYVHGTGVDEPIVWFEGTSYSTKRYLVSNYQGSIIAYTDSGGSRQETYTYDAYGKPGGTNGWSPTRSRFGYTGQTILREAQLDYYKARVYDPSYGHFMQTDPIGSKDDLDLYAYTGDDPVNKVDALGTQVVEVEPDLRDPYEDEIRVENGRSFSIGSTGGRSTNANNYRGPAATFAGTPGLQVSRTVEAEAEAEATYYKNCSDDPAVAAAQARLLARSSGQSTVREGIYEFPDRTGGQSPYVGQSGNIPSRLARHEAAGRLERGTETTREVLGGTTAREIAEHGRIQEITGGQKAGNSANVTNRRDPIGAGRRGKLGISDPTD